MTTDWSCSFFLNYNHENIITRNTQLLYVPFCSYWPSRSDIPKIFLQDDKRSILLELH